MKSAAFLTPSLTLFLFLSGCATVNPTLSQDTKILVSIRTADVLVSGGITEDVAKSFGRQVIKQLGDELDARGIKHESRESSNGSDASVTIELNGLQAESKLDAGAFKVSTKMLYRVRYVATVIAPDGRLLTRFDVREGSEVLDSLPQKVGRYVGKRVAAHYPNLRP